MIILSKGQVETIVMEYDGKMFEVELSNNDDLGNGNLINESINVITL
ncbi:MAG: hypothetical protein AB4058_07715 [Microcystaceae cyanobacterium]